MAFRPNPKLRCLGCLGILLLSGALLSATPAVAQDAGSDRESTESDYAFASEMPFSGWKIINLPTDRTVGAGNWLFLISHRFSRPVGDGYSAFYGLDGPAIMYLSMGYALTDDFLVLLARSNAADNVEMQTRYRLLEESRPQAPVGLAAHGSVNWLTQDPWREEAFKFTGQLSLTRTLADQVGLALVPGLTINPAEGQAGEPPLFTLGLGARWKVQEKVAIVGEWTPRLSGVTEAPTFGHPSRFDTWGAGVEITTEGHVFQLVVTNHVGLTTDQYLRGGDLDFGSVHEGEFRLGFNIFRILDFSKF